MGTSTQKTSALNNFLTILEFLRDQYLHQVEHVYMLRQLKFLNQVLIRSGREEQAMLTSLAGLIVVLFIIVAQISRLFETIKNLFGLY